MDQRGSTLFSRVLRENTWKQHESRNEGREDERDSRVVFSLSRERVEREWTLV